MKPFTALRKGDPIQIRALRSDGVAYRWRTATVDSHSAREIVTVTREGNVMTQPPPASDWLTRLRERTFYWLDRPYIVGELYSQKGEPAWLYAHVASLPILQDRRIVYTDHELDVVKHPNEEPRVVDEDEFDEALVLYGYSREFQEHCWRVVEVARELLANWSWHGAI